MSAAATAATKRPKPKRGPASVGGKPSAHAGSRVRSTRRTGKTRTIERVLEDLSSVADDIRNVEEDLATKRELRNGLILEGRNFSKEVRPTLEKLADVGGVGVSYASRIEKAHGKPSSGNPPRKAAESPAAKGKGK